MTATQPTSPEVNWRARGRDDAPVAQRAIIRTMLDNDPPVPGHACAYAIVEAYGGDLKVAMPGVVSVHTSEHRHRILLQLINAANHDEWRQLSLGGPDDFMAEYWAGFLKELDSRMTDWAPRPWKPGPNADLVAKKKKWRFALTTNNLTLPIPQTTNNTLISI